MRSMRVLFCIAVGLFTAAQLPASGPQHFYVINGGSGAGCTFAAPCGSWATAIGLAASQDEITALSAGDFGPIDLPSGKGVTIDGGGQDAGVLAGTVTVHVADFETVTLRGLDLNGFGAGATAVGVTFSRGGNLIIDSCEIQNYGKRGVSIESSTNTAKVLITNTIVAGGANNGIVVIPPGSTTNTVLLDHVRVAHNQNSGVGVNAGGVVEIRDSAISNNAVWGLVTSGGAVSLENTTVSGNAIGLEADNAGGTIRLSNVNVWNNTTGLAVSGGGSMATFGNNQLHGNFTNGPVPANALSLQ